MNRHRIPQLRRAALFVLCAAAALLAWPGATAAQDRPVSLRYTSNAPPKSPWAMQIQRLADTVATQSQGNVKVEPFLAGQLGNEQDTIQQVARGRIDMGNFAMGAVTLLVPELQMLMLPFYFESAAEQDCVLDKHLSGAIDGLLAAKGLKLLGYGEVGVIDLASKKSLLDVASARGLKATAYSKTQGMFWSSIGVNATFIGTPEWASALQTGLIDFTTSPVALYVPAGINKAAPVYNRLNLWYTPALTLMNRGRYDSLGAAQKAALHKAYDIEAAPKLRAEIRGLEDKLRQAHVAGGGQLLEPSPAQRAGWRDAAAKVWPQMVEVVGGQAGNFFKTIEAARGSCKG